MHLLGFDHVHATPEEQALLSETIWKADNVELITVGVDIGSSTSHLMFSKVHLQRLAEALSSRFVVVGREILWRSPILLTPYNSDNTIDADKLRKFIEDAYKSANLKKDDIDSGAVILTGEALKRDNSRAIADLFAEESGKFVCASAGHNLEAIMAAHGSGAVALSRTELKTFINVDIGGGTTKLALVHGGRVIANSAFAVGGRLIAMDEDNTLNRVEGPALQMAKSAGIELKVGEKISDGDRDKLVKTMVDVIVAYVNRQPTADIAKELAVTPYLPDAPVPNAVTFSGGVSEYIYGRETTNRGDVGHLLAAGITDALADKRIDMPIYDPGQGIRATVIGASQFSVQVSGNTVLVSNDESLPLRNIPVINIAVKLPEKVDSNAIAEEIGRALERFDIVEGEADIALAFRWEGDPLHARLFGFAEGVCKGLKNSIANKRPLVLMMEGDVGKTMGEIFRRELGVENDIISIDDVQLKEFDYVDIGKMIRPTNVVPLVIKSLLFSQPKGD
jgi:ethanolamine utilization protein EutA